MKATKKVRRTIIERYINNETPDSIAVGLKCDIDFVYDVLKESGTYIDESNNVQIISVSKVKISEQNKKSIVSLHLFGVPIDDIATQLGLNSLAVKRYLIEQNLIQESNDTKQSSITSAKFDTIQIMHKNGYSIREISDQLGIDTRIVEEYVLSKCNMARISNKQHNEIVKMYKEGKKISHISSIIGCSDRAVVRHLIEEDIYKKQWTRFSDTDLLQISQLYKHGEKIDDIAKKFNSTHNTICEYLKMMGAYEFRGVGRPKSNDKDYEQLSLFDMDDGNAE